MWSIPARDRTVNAPRLNPKRYTPIAGLETLHETAVGVFDVLLQALSRDLVALGAQTFHLLVVVPSARPTPGS